jgi:hypothetical protein
MEQWKSILGYESYLVSSLGEVKRIYKNKVEKTLTKINNGHDYMCVCLCKNGIAKRFYVHRIVASAFLDNSEKKDEVNHIDGDRQNNSLLNLEWVTRSENHIHRYKVLKRDATNKGKFGLLNWNSKKVAMYNLNGDLIKIYPAVMEAARDLKINDSSIRGVIYGKQKTCKGHTFKYI